MIHLVGAQHQQWVRSHLKAAVSLILLALLVLALCLPVAGEEPASAASSTPRTIQFPSDRSMGTLSILTGVDTRRYRIGPNDTPPPEWQYVAEARGIVTVPVYARVMLSVGRSALGDLSPLAELGSHDLYALSVSCPEGEDANPDKDVMPYLSGLTGLKELSLNRYAISGVGARHLTNLKELEYFHMWLSSERFDGAVLAQLAELDSLEALYLYASVTDRDLRHLIGLTSLRELAVKVNDLHGPGLDHLSTLPNLEFLGLLGAGFSDDSLRYLRDLTSLRSLKFHGEGLNIGDAGLAHLSGLTGLEELRFVLIKNITDAGMRHLTPLRNLRVLDLYSARVTDAGLAQLTALQKLEELHLPKTAATDRALAVVSELSNLRRLSGNGSRPADQTKPGSYTDGGLQHLTKLQRLEVLKLCSGIGVTDVGVGYIAELPRLKYLLLAVNGVTNAGMAQLATVESLTTLNLRLRGVTVAGVNHLNALPNLEHLAMGRVLRDDSALDLSSLGELEKLSLSVMDRPGRDGRGALRDDDLACLADHTQLRWLQLGYSPALTDAGLAHLDKLDELERVSIGGEQVTDAGLAYLSDKKAINCLSLQGDFSEEGLRALDGLSALGSLRLDTKEELSMLAVARLREALPNLLSFNGVPCQRQQ
jgi:Leucine-rich repeat (LRR) protein